MSRALLAGVLAALIGSGCSNQAYRSYDANEMLDAARAQPLASDGAFAEMGDDDEWLFEPSNGDLEATSLTVGARTEFFADGKRVDRGAVREGMPVRVTWDPERSEILRVEMTQPAGGPEGGAVRR